MELGPNQTLWLEALRSGLYAQGKHHLNSPDGFCCLGVACEIFKATLDLEVQILPTQTFYQGSSGTAPVRVIEHLGLYGDVGEADPTCSENSLAHLNDYGVSFHEIADLITADPALYFRSAR